MSAEAELDAEAGTTAPVDSYDPVLKAMHWASLVLVTAAFTAVWASHLAANREQSLTLLELHHSLGITVFGLTLFRLAWRCHAPVPRLPADLPAVQKLAARVTEYCLYLLLLVQPILGIVHTNARGRAVGFYFLGQFPIVVSPDKALAKEAMTAHELIGYLLLALVGLHAAAALFHHFIRRDGVLETMLPRRR